MTGHYRWSEAIINIMSKITQLKNLCNDDVISKSTYICFRFNKILVITESLVKYQTRMMKTAGIFGIRRRRLCLILFWLSGIRTVRFQLSFSFLKFFEVL